MNLYREAFLVSRCSRILQLLFGMAVSTFPDIAGGLLIAHAANKIVGNFSWWSYVVGVFFAIAPDLDAAIQPLMRKVLDTYHRDLTHKPMIVVGLALLASVMWPFYGLIATAALTWHYLDDSIGDHVGSGLKWLAPLWNKQVGFFQTRDGKRLLVKVWSDEEIEAANMALVPWLESTYIPLTFTSARSWVTLTVVVWVIAATW